MLTITPQLPITQTSFRPQAARPQDSEGGFSVLPGMPVGGVSGRIELMSEASGLQAAMMEAINEAKTSIKADFHLLRGREGQELARQLARRSRQGIRVQILAWGAPSAALTEAVKVARSNGLNVRIGRHDGPHATSPVGKFLLVDDRTAMIGALRQPSASKLARRALLRVTGDAALELARQFNHDWAATGGTPMSLPEFGVVQRSGTHELISQIQIGGNGPQRKAPKALVMAAIQRAHSTVEVMLDELDDADVLAALVSAHRRGAKVRVLLSGEGRHARAIATLRAAGVPVRLYQAGGTAQAIELRLAVIDGETLLFGSAAWTRTGLAAGGELLLEARGGRELSLVRATFVHDWTHAAEASAPSTVERVKAEVAPALAAVSRLVGLYNPAKAVNDLMGLHVGVVKLPGGRVKMIAEVRH